MPASQGSHGPSWMAMTTCPRPCCVPPAPHPVACLPPCRVPPPPPLCATAAGITCRRHPTTPTRVPLTHLTARLPTLSIHPPAEFPSCPLACHPRSLLLAPMPTTPQTCRCRPMRMHLPPTTHVAHLRTEPQPQTLRRHHRIRAHRGCRRRPVCTQWHQWSPHPLGHTRAAQVT